jgi:hypothetical protein
MVSGPVASPVRAAVSDPPPVPVAVMLAVFAPLLVCG